MCASHIHWNFTSCRQKQKLISNYIIAIRARVIIKKTVNVICENKEKKKEFLGDGQ